METRALKFEVDGFDVGLESTRTGDYVEISFASLPVLGFDARDVTARNWTIAALLSSGLKGKTVAGLCFVSPAKVCSVHARVREGGFEALARRYGSGRPKKLTPDVVEEARTLRAQGLTPAEIGRKLGLSRATAAVAVKGQKRGEQPMAPQVELELSLAVEEAKADGPKTDGAVEVEEGTKAVEEAESDAVETVETAEVDVGAELVGDVLVDEGDEGRRSGAGGGRAEELEPGEPLPAGPSQHPCRYAGTLLLCAALQALGVFEAMKRACVHRPEKAVYSASQAVVALMSAWASGLRSLEAMHERDARSLGVVLGLERCPSVRTLHRAVAQMVASFDPAAFGAALLRGLMAAVGGYPRVFGVDGHFKSYFGKEPIDKGWDTKRRIAHRGLADVLVHDERGRIWQGFQVGAGDGLSEHVLSTAQQLRRQMGAQEPIVLAFDRGGFCFEALNALAEGGFGYVAWVPATVSLPDLATIAPTDDGIGEQRWTHDKLESTNRARLLVQRDGEALLPMVTNLPEEVSAVDAMTMLRKVRGWQENDIKAARAFAHIDRLVDRGGAERAPDDRLVRNPERKELLEQRRQVRRRIDDLERMRPLLAADRAVRDGEHLVAEMTADLLRNRLSATPSKMPVNELDPTAERSTLKTRNRALLQPLKYALANARRWLVEALGPEALAPSDAPWDTTALGRTALALLQAPGSVTFSRDQVAVVLDLPLPPKPHERLDRGLAVLNERGLLFSDGSRRVTFRLAPRPTKDSLPSAASHPGAAGAENSR